MFSLNYFFFYFLSIKVNKDINNKNITLKSIVLLNIIKKCRRPIKIVNVINIEKE